MALVKGIGGMVTFTSVKDANGADVSPAIPEWGSGNAYEIDDVVEIPLTGQNKKYYIAKLTHTSVAGDNTTPGTATAALDSAKWRQIELGNVTNLISWSLDESASTESKQVLYEETARTVGTTVATTGQLVFSFEDKDAVQMQFRSRYSGVLTIYRTGIGNDKPTITCNIEITGRGDAGDENVQDVTIDYAVNGPVDHGRTDA